MIVSYDGTHFHGFQRQPGEMRTVQGELERSLEELLGERAEVYGASRTDAGVHAIGQVVHFTTESRIPPERIARALGRYLPDDLAAVDSSPGDEAFHARFSAVGKLYHYLINRSPAPSLLLRNAAHSAPGPLDVPKMAEALKLLIGEHDFSAFGNKGSAPASPVRRMYRLGVDEKGGFLVFRLHGSGFLYKMARNIVGTMLEVGRGRLKPEEIGEILLSRDRDAAGPAAPPNGLYLVRVFYDRPENENDSGGPDK